MTEAEFISRAIGVQWIRWRSDWAAMDCAGLVHLYHLEVLGLDLGPVPQTDIASGFVQTDGWLECGPEPGVTAFMAWQAGAPSHCGMLVSGGRLLHSQGTVEHGGSVRLSRLTVMSRIYDDVRFYRNTRC